MSTLFALTLSSRKVMSTISASQKQNNKRKRSSSEDNEWSKIPLDAMRAKWSEMISAVEEKHGLKMPKNVMKTKVAFISFFKENSVSPSEVEEKTNLGITSHVSYDAIRM